MTNPAYIKRVKQLKHRVLKKLRACKALFFNESVPWDNYNKALNSWFADQRELNILTGNPELKYWDEEDLQ